MITARSSSRDRVFIVDDSKPMSLLISRILSKYFIVRSFSCALNAFAHIKYEGAPDVLITDYLMPDINGLEFVRNIRENGLIPGIPIFVLTGASPSQISEDLFHYDVRAVIPKPFEPEMLINRVFNELETSVK